MKYIYKVGVELEGGWNRRPLRKVIVEDRSVRTQLNHNGEINSPAFSDLDALEEWLVAHRPDGVDTSCGFHIHLSFKSRMDYLRLTTPRFYRFLLKIIKAWAIEKEIPETHHFWKRFRGTFRAPNGRNFCRKDFTPETQLYETRKGPDGSARHCHLNFCWTLHKTLELRLFPGWETERSALYMSGVHCFVEAVEKFLLRERKRKVNNIKLKLEPFKRRPR